MRVRSTGGKQQCPLTANWGTPMTRPASATSRGLPQGARAAHAHSRSTALVRIMISSFFITPCCRHIAGRAAPTSIRSAATGRGSLLERGAAVIPHAELPEDDRAFGVAIEALDLAIDQFKTSQHGAASRLPVGLRFPAGKCNGPRWVLWRAS